MGKTRWAVEFVRFFAIWEFCLASLEIQILFDENKYQKYILRNLRASKEVRKLEK